MPKIVINEYDLTKAGTGDYANFSVVVPGFLGEGKTLAGLQAQGIFDENGVYECASQADFIAKVGKTFKNCTVLTETTPAIAPEITAILKLGAANGVTTDGKTTIYTYADKEDFSKVVSACLNGYEITDKAYLPTNITESQKTGGFGVYTASINVSRQAGKLKDTERVYTGLTAEEGYDVSVSVDENTLVFEGTPTFDENITTCYIIEDANKGTDAVMAEKTVAHYGNQIAYELLGLGYTVLYKAMECHNDISDTDFWSALKDKSTYDFRYVVTGLLTDNGLANNCIIGLCEWINKTLDDADILTNGRGDCIALIDLDSARYAGCTQTTAIPKLAEEASKYSSAYAAVFAPYVTYVMAEDEAYTNNTTFPASFHYLACAANSAVNNYAEWYANAGYTRGVSKYSIKTTGCKLGEMAVQALQPRFTIPAGTVDGVKVNTDVAVNLVIKIKNSYYLWGNRTSKKLGTRGASDGDLVAQHFLNIRQLCTTIKKQVYVTCRRLTFDPNSNTLWINFRSLLTPMLEQMKADQGIRDYEFVKEATDRKALLAAKIRIVPIEAVEDFEIGLYLEDNLAEVSVTEA